MSTTRGYYKMKDYRMKELTEEYCAKGIGAVETSQRMQAKFGDSAPTICTIYKWRRDFREGQEGKREREDRKEIELLDEGQKSAKIPRKVSSDKYCAECNRDLCNRQYFELHMLKFHDVLLGDTKSVIEYLDQLEPTRTQHLVFRCDACFGGALDYDTIEEFQQHKLVEHGQTMRMPKWCFKKVKSPTKIPLQNVRSSVAPAASRITPPTAPISKYTKVIIRRDKSLPASSSLRRSNRVPKPISTLNCLMLAKDFNEMRNSNERGGGEKEKEERKNSPTKEFSKKGRPSMNRSVNFKEETKEIVSTTNEGLKLEGNVNKEKSTSAHTKQQQKEEGNNVNGGMNGIGGLSPEQEEEEEEIGIKEDPVELEKETQQIQQQKQQQENPQDNPPANDKSEAVSSPHRRRMLSPDALEAANSLLKLTFGSPLSITGVFEEQNSSPIANECICNGEAIVTTKTTATTTKSVDTSISSNLPNSPPPTVSSSSTSTIQQQKQSIKLVTNNSNLLPQSSPNLPKLPTPQSHAPLHLPLPQPQNMSGFSNAELAEIEKVERKAVETRIQALRNIQVLFDQAMLQFQQYLAAMPSTNTTIVGNGNGNSEPINGIIQQQEVAAISNLVPSSSSMGVDPSTSSSSSSTSMLPKAIQNGISACASSSTTITNNKS